MVQNNESDGVFSKGGLIGPGTLLSAFGFGPVIAFFNRTVSEPLLKESAGGRKI